MPSHEGLRRSPYSSISRRMVRTTRFNFSIRLWRSRSRRASDSVKFRRFRGPRGSAPPSATSSWPRSSTP